MRTNVRRHEITANLRFFALRNAVYHKSEAFMVY